MKIEKEMEENKENVLRDWNTIRINHYTSMDYYL